MRGCACGAIEATDAAYRQMTVAEQSAFKRRARNCATCHRDRNETIRRDMSLDGAVNG